VSGEQVSYQYDCLRRLVAAATAGPEWGLKFTYDGFGNRLSQEVTKGTAPTVYSNYNAATNRIAGYTHDGNGNILGLPNGTTLTWDVENRVTTATAGGTVETYYYAPDGKRVYRKAADGKQYIYFYGVMGERIGPYFMGPYVGQLMMNGTPPAYFAGRRLGTLTDRLGSVRVTSYYPYGEQKTTTAEDDVRFATYMRDSATGLDYAVNRYYSSIIGRFLSPDPYRGNTDGPGDPANPQSWNRYAYVQNDPVNASDPTGQYLVFIGWGWDWDMGPEGEAVPAYVAQFAWMSPTPNNLDWGDVSSLTNDPFLKQYGT
jgi:RHS repeat-associated protein